MKTTLALIALTLSSPVLATILQSTGCHLIKETQNMVCTFKVTGEEPQDPSAKSVLYSTTKMPYALCSKALCTPNKKDPELANCTCEVFGVNDKQKWHGASVGPLPVDKSAPTEKDGKLLTVTSNFSMANIQDLGNIPQVTCKSDTPMKWANCFGVKCDVTYEGEIPMANCACPIAQTKAFVSIGPKDKDQCKIEGKIWSAATSAQGKNNNLIMGDVYLWSFASQPN